jgi:hypothetical protein
MTKQEEWDELATRFARVTDRLGRPIDPEIMETVIALNALSITTTMSCGGHIDDGRGLLMPWIDIASLDPALDDIRKEAVQLGKEADELRKEERQLREEKADTALIQARHEQSNEKYKAMHATYHRGRALQCKVRDILIQHLTRFYENRTVPFDRRLILNVSPAGLAHTRLLNQGSGDFYLLALPDIQRQKLLEYREEITAFTEFLKAIFFADASDNQST